MAGARMMRVSKIELTKFVAGELASRPWRQPTPADRSRRSPSADLRHGSDATSDPIAWAVLEALAEHAVDRRHDDHVLRIRTTTSPPTSTSPTTPSPEHSAASPTHDLARAPRRPIDHRPLRHRPLPPHVPARRPHSNHDHRTITADRRPTPAAQPDPHHDLDQSNTNQLDLLHRTHPERTPEP